MFLLNSINGKVAPAPDVEKENGEGQEPYVRRVECCGGNSGLKIVQQGKRLPPIISQISSKQSEQMQVGDLVLVFNHHNGNKLGQYADRAYIQNFLKWSEKGRALRLKTPRQFQINLKLTGVYHTNDGIITRIDTGTPLEGLVFPGDKIIKDSSDFIVLQRPQIEDNMIRDALLFCGLSVRWIKTHEFDLGQRRVGRCQHRESFFSSSLKFALYFYDHQGVFSVVFNDKKKSSFVLKHTSTQKKERNLASLRSKLQAAVDHCNKQRKIGPPSILTSASSFYADANREKSQKEEVEDDDYAHHIML